MSRIANALGAAREVIESNHPTANVKTAETGGCDYRISSVGASITVTANSDDFIVTDEDIDEIEERGTDAVSGRQMEYKKEDGDTVWFELRG